MCLKYGTPHRYRLATMEGLVLPEHCENRATLLALLRQEVTDGHYDNPERYHPLLAAGLRGLAERPEAVHPTLQEPNYPFCDLIQTLALVAGISNVGDGVPTVAHQHCRMVWSDWLIRPDVYFKFWHVLQVSCPAASVAPWTTLLETIFRHSGWNGLLMRAGMEMERESGQQVLFTADRAA